MIPTTTDARLAPARQAIPWYRQRWPWLLMLGPATVLVGGAYITTLAIRHPDAMVVDDYYNQGRAINQDLRRDRAASSLRLALQAGYEPRAGRLAGRITGAGKPFTAPFRLRLAHPTLPRKDLVLLAVPDADGRFSLALPQWEATHWQVVAEGSLNDWRLARSWNWKKQGALTIEADR
jgi:hypothetical protein